MNVELTAEQKKELEVVERFHSELKRIDTQVRKVIVGQNDVVEQVMMTLLAGGNSMITGVPGLAKTLLIATVAQVLHLNFKRIQFTPDLMPGDITGSEIIEEDRTTGKRERIFRGTPLGQAERHGADETVARADRAPRLDLGSAQAPAARTRCEQRTIRA